MKKLKLLLLLMGFGVFALLVYVTGLDVIYKYMIALKWNWFLVLTPFAFVYIFDTLGWKYSFHKNVPKVPYHTLFVTRLAGEAINYITPTAYMGGEPIKARLLKKKGISTVEAVSSVIIAKTTMTIAQIIFAVLGITLAFSNFELPNSVKIGSVVCIITGILLLLFVISKQKRGFFIPILNFLKRVNITFLEKKRADIEALDENLVEFHETQESYFIMSTLFHLIGWMIGAVEVYLIVWSMGVEISMVAALVVESLFVVIKAVFFIIPGSLGAQEGGTVLIFTTLGFSTPIGLTVGIVKRMRELVWIIIGLGILARFELRAGKKDKCTLEVET